MTIKLVELAERLERAIGAEDINLSIALLEALDIASYITDDGDPLTSLDAATALCERVLPDYYECDHPALHHWCWSVEGTPSGRSGAMATIWVGDGPFDIQDDSVFAVRVKAITPALALCRAIVAAKLRMQETANG